MKIAIVGKMCSGKTTLANYIMSKDPRHKIFSFGKGVKDIAYNYFDMKEKDRSLLINIASKMKEIDNDIWIKYLFNTINSQYCIIDDVRHQNELDYLIKNGWFIIHLNIDKQTQQKRLMRLYSNNYDDHLKNINDISENCDKLIYPPKYPHLYFNSNDSIHQINMTIISLLEKNK